MPVHIFRYMSGPIGFVVTARVDIIFVGDTGVG
jgi:hypothetical protein